jgi:hypothetical protein
MRAEDVLVATERSLRRTQVRRSELLPELLPASADLSGPQVI